MIQIPPHAKIFVYINSIDGRKGLDSCLFLIKKEFGVNPMDGSFFLFINKSKIILSVLFYDGQGYWLAKKRISKGKFPTWPSESKISSIVASQLFWAVKNITKEKINTWKSLTN
jgi:hypothetical protein